MTQTEFEDKLVQEGYAYKPKPEDLEFALTGLLNRLGKEGFAPVAQFAHHEQSHRLTPPVETFCNKLTDLLRSERRENYYQQAQAQYDEFMTLINLNKKK